VYKRHIRLASLMLALVALVGCTRASASSPTPTPVTAATPVAARSHSSGNGVVASGVVAPETWATLSAQAGGTVVEVLVEPGQQVAAGAPVVHLDTTELETALRIARQGVALQEALLAQLAAGASEQVIARAERENAYQIAQAELTLEASQQQLQQARARDPAQDVAVARARVRQLELQLSQARVQRPAPEITMAQVELERAKIALDETQDEYNKALDRPWEDQEIRDAWIKKLKQAQLNRQLAQAQLERAENAHRAHAISLSVLGAQLEETKTLLAQALDAQKAYSATLSMLEIEIRAAQLQLDHLRAWENPYLDQASEHEIAQAKTRLEQAKLAVVQIEQQIAEAEIRAPFAGTVTSVHVRRGELVTPGQPLITLGDLATLRAETVDLSERDVDQVAVGQQATVYMEALGVESVGRVVSIAPEATTVGGDVVYRVTVELDEPPPDLRWGMSVEVEIETR
jgi:HlyD family secretion protein